MTQAFGPPPPQLTFHAQIIPIGAGLFAATFVTDLFYCATWSGQWETFSIWLLAAGLVVAAIAGLALVADIALHRLGRLSWVRFFALLAVALLSLLNAFVHSRDGYTAVAPGGVTLSAVVTLILVVIGLRGWSLSD